MADAEHRGQLIDCDDSRVSTPVFQAANILLTEAGKLGETLLGQALLLPDPLDVAADQRTHVHAYRVDKQVMAGLSTIVCISLTARGTFPQSLSRPVEGEMKEQYVGDVNDYRKYALLRHFATEGKLRIGVCWMLTPADGGADGGLTKYLDQAPLCDDDDLFAKLKHIGKLEAPRRLHLVEREKLIPGALYFDEFLSDRTRLRRAFFDAAFEHLSRADLIFFDPDNGLAPPSTPAGARNSSKYVYRNEIHEAYYAGHSVLVYQHFIRETRGTYIDRVAVDFAACAQAAQIWCFWTPHTAFFLLVHPRHAKAIAPAAEKACRQWSTNFICGKRIAVEGPS
jgi:hypothetical protein